MVRDIEIKEITLHDYIDLLLRRKWTILICFALVLLAAIYFNYTRPPKYESVATFIIESNEPVIPMLTGVKMTEPARPFEFYQAIVASRLFKVQATNGIIAHLKDSANVEISFQEAWKLLEKNLTATSPEYSDFVELHSVANDPQITYILATVTAKTLKERCQEIDKEESMNIVTFVDKQKIKILQELERVEKELQEFKEQTDALIAGENGGLIKELVQMESELLNLQTQRELAESNLEEYEQQLHKMNLRVDESLDKTEMPEIERLRQEIDELEDIRNGLVQVTGKNTEIANLDKRIEEKKRELIRKIIRSASNPNLENEGANILWQKLLEQKVSEELKFGSLRNREEFYKNLISNFRNKHPNMLEHAIKLNQLKRAKSVHENLHAYLLEKGEEAKIKAATGTGGIRIVDPPNWPQEPSPRGTIKNLLLAIILGLGLGIGLAIFQDYFDNTIRTPDDITNSLKLPVMGVIPFIKSQNGAYQTEGQTENTRSKMSPRQIEHLRSIRLISRLKPKDPIVETYRGLRTNLQFAEVDQKLRSILITSSRPQEGKTITAANLAIAFAEVGKKTILIDTDLRKPKIHNIFHIKREPGLLECLVEQCEPEEVTHSPADLNLKVIPAGKIPPNPTQVLSSHKMTAFIQKLEQEYDIVIFDSPPLAAVTDPVLISKQVSGVLLVVRFEFTDLNIAKNSIEILKKSKANILGVALNYTDFSRGYSYYNQYYNYYNYYYEDTAES